MEQINMVYVDDKPDPYLERYLDNYYKKCSKVIIKYSEVVFDSSKGYENLLLKDEIKSANIIFIDSLLFENDTVGNHKFTGEEMRMLLRKQYPYIETILITQNEIDDSIEHIRKYSSSRDKENYETYYDRVIPIKINNAIRNIITYRRSMEKINDNPSWESVIKEKLSNCLEGINNYNEMTKDDIDEVVRLLKDIQEKYDV